MNKKMHLVPIVIQDIVTNMNNPSTPDFQKELYVERLEVIRDYCIDVLSKNINKKRA